MDPTQVGCRPRRARLVAIVTAAVLVPLAGGRADAGVTYALTDQNQLLRFDSAAPGTHLTGVYRTCLFCHGDLGRNEALDAFPVGRRLAYDAAKGRLWVVCRVCERWNLTPQEERWEAIEQAERQYRATRLRASTRNVGLARLHDGTELVRIGAPLRPEFAAWRYGDQFGRRRRRHLWLTGGLATAGVAVAVLGPLTGLLSASTIGSLWNVGWQVTSGRNHRRRHALPLADGSAFRVAAVDIAAARLAVEADGVLRLRIGGQPARARPAGGGWTDTGAPGAMEFEGAHAMAAAGSVLPLLNKSGGARYDVERAVAMLADRRDPASLFAALAGADALRTARTAGLGQLAPPYRLALEMAAHEEQERRALEGELHELETAWRRAEEIAAIADELLLPERLTARLGQISARSSARAGAASSPSSSSGGASSS